MAVAKEDAENRCQCVTTKGQCIQEALEGSNFCASHGGNKAVEANAKRDANNYRLHQWQTRIKDFKDSSSIKSLRDEIGILRLLMEERLNAATTPAKLMMESHHISRLAGDIRSTVESCHKLESQMGQMMDKQAIIRFAGQVVSIVSSVTQSILDSNLITQEVVNIIGNDIADKLLEQASADSDAS